MAPTKNNGASEINSKPGNNTVRNANGTLPVSPKSPAYIREQDIGQINGYILGQKVRDQLNTRDVKCVQKVKNLWRIYISNDVAKLQLTMQGLNLDGKIIKVYATNPHRTGALRAIAEGADDNIEMIRVIIKDLYTSVSEKDILHMLQDVYGVKVATPIRELFWRDPVTKKLSADLLSGDRECFVHPDQLEGKPLPRYAICGTWNCRIFHKDQFPKGNECFNCFQTDHISSNCKNPKACKVCKEPGHLPGSPSCLHYYGPKPLNFRAYGGKEDPLSNHYEYTFTYNHLPGKSVEHHWYYQKGMIHGQPKLAKLCMDAPTAAMARTLGHGIRCAPDWDNSDRAKELMRDIQESKFEEVIPFQESIHDAHINGQYLVEAVPKNGVSYWSSGLSKEATLHTNPHAWPGHNNMGQILNDLAVDRYGSFWVEKDHTDTDTDSERDTESTNSDNEMDYRDEQDGYATGLPRPNLGVPDNTATDSSNGMDKAIEDTEAKSKPKGEFDDASVEPNATENIVVSSDNSPKAISEQVAEMPQPTVEQGKSVTIAARNPLDLTKVLPKGDSKKFKKALKRQSRIKNKNSTPGRRKMSESPRSPSCRRSRSNSPSSPCKVHIKSNSKDEMQCVKPNKSVSADDNVS